MKLSSSKFWNWCGHAIFCILAISVAEPAARAQCTDWSGSFGIPGQGVNGPVNVVKSFQTPQGERLFIGGNFSQAGGVPAVNVAMWDGSSWSAVGDWTSGGAVTDLEYFDDGSGPLLYASGGNVADGTTGLAKLVGSQWIQVGGGVYGQIQVLKAHVFNNAPALFAAGRFSEAGGIPCDSIAAWTATGWKRWAAPPDYRHLMSTIHDPVRDRLVLFGKYTNGSGPGDTWEWDGATWTRVSTSGPTPLENTPMAFDSTRQRVLLIAGNPTSPPSPNAMWAWNGTAWSNLAAVPFNMTAGSQHAITYDAARDRVVVFGGFVDSSTRSGQTWEFDGTTWSLRTPAHTPSPRVGSAMGYDPIRQRVVLFSGYALNSIGDNETWEWDGVDWTLRANTGPATRTGGMFTFNPATSSLILAGGHRIESSGGSRDDIWSWNGTTWTQIAATSSGPNSSNDMRALDTIRQRIVAAAATHVRPLAPGDWQLILRGGFLDGQGLGTASSLEVHTDESGEHIYAAGSFELASGQSAEGIARLEGDLWVRAGARTRRDVTLIKVASGPHAGLWGEGDFRTPGNVNLYKWQAGDWQAYIPADGGEFRGTVFAADLGQGPQLCGIGYTVPGAVFFSSNALYTLQPEGWRPYAYREPSARTLVSMAYDPIRRESVLFGGTTNQSPSGALGDTEVFNGRTWTTRQVTGPTARYEHAMTFDAARGVVVLVGGMTSSEAADGQTWTWNGSVWTLASASIGGGARYGHAIAYDPTRQKVVLFGGRNAFGIVMGDTWEWDGQQWTPVATTGPSPRDRHAMVFDPTRGKVVLATGRSPGNIDLSDLWTWDGTQWSLINADAGWASLADLVFDKVDNRLELYIRQVVLKLNASNQWVDTGADFGLTDRRGRAIAYDTTQNTPVTFGGHFFDGSSNTNYADTRILRDDFEPAMVLMGNMKDYGAFSTGTARRHFFAMTLADQSNAGVAVLGDPCVAPTIIQQPSNQTAVYNSSVSFTVAAVGTQPIAYQWRRNGVPIVNIPGTISGAQSKTLQFGTAWSFANAGTYDCVASSPFGEAISQSAEFDVENTGPNGPVQLTKVVYPPEPLQGEPSVVLSAFSPAWIANTGRVGFLAGSNAGNLIAAWKNGSTTQLARVSQNAPEIEEPSTFDQLSAVDMSSGTGGVLFSGRLLGDLDAGYANGLWFNDEAGSSLVVRQGLGAAGTDAVFGFQNGFPATINASGTIVFRASLVGGGALPETSVGLWTWQRNVGQTLHARTGSIAPGGATPFTHFDQFDCADDGAVTILGRAGGIFGIWSGPLGSLTRRAIAGELAPGITPPKPIIDVNSPFTRGPDGNVYFVARIQNSPALQEVMYASTSEGASPLLRSGVQVPGQPAGTTFARFFPIAANASGELLFRAIAVCTDCPSLEGMFLRNASGEIAPLFFGPGTPPVGVSAFFTSATVGTLGSLTDLSQVVFSATVNNGPVNGPAIFGWTPSSGTFGILAPGHQVAIAPGVYRTVTGASIINGNAAASGSSRSKSLNPFGQVVIQVTFSDETSGLFRGTFGQFLTAIFDCPTFAVPVADTTQRVGRQALLSAEVAGNPPFTFQWKKDGVPLTNAGRFSGVDTQQLSINAVDLNDAGIYTLEASNDCDNSVASSATLTVLCPADLDDGTFTGHADGAITIDDLLYFLAAFEQGTTAADIDNGFGQGIPDEAVTIDDLLFFLARFEAGC